MRPDNLAPDELHRPDAAATVTSVRQYLVLKFRGTASNGNKLTAAAPPMHALIQSDQGCGCDDPAVD